MPSNVNVQQLRKKRWSERDTLKFVELYEAEEVLWNVQFDESSFPSPDALSEIPSQEVPVLPDIPHSPDIPTSPPSDLCAHPSPNSSHFTVPPHPARKRAKRALPQHIEKSIETLQSIKNKALCNREVEDEFYYFGKNIASQLRQLPLTDALDAQTEILNLLRMKRQHILQQTSSSSYSPQSECFIEIPDHVDIFDAGQNIPIRVLKTYTPPNTVIQATGSENDVRAENILEEAIRNIPTISEDAGPEDPDEKRPDCDGESIGHCILPSFEPTVALDVVGLFASTGIKSSSELSSSLSLLVRSSNSDTLPSLSETSTSASNSLSVNGRAILDIKLFIY
ncbi:unnamed protein product [Acanthoscelides obtectus]|uniref:Uncharacterized protein n=1 Tax=Acanthoscelides obtectus TaxID=200917 RepID=A0A9P0PLQ2_ACAOB|nr:unnamed protein product [Acanthoscelides obtectus]CAK1671763.1 hypothetical protein AOBTE_LOCUS28445 [Acanthoscelides obtectus]